MTSFKSLCESCQHQGCCTDSSVPLVFSNDFKALQDIKKSGDEYLQDLEIKGRKVKALKKKKNSTVCVFWDEEKKTCSVYENRPFDCRAYPFDIRLINGKYHWIVYSCNPDSNWKWSENFLEELEEYVMSNGILKDIETFANNTELILPKESLKTSFVVLREVKIDNLRIPVK